MTVDTIDAIDVSVGMSIDTVGVALGLGRTLRVLFAVGTVSLVEGEKVSRDGKRSIDNGIFGGEVGLEEVVGVGHEGTVDG